MNYIEYLNTVFDVWDRDDRITVYHRSVFLQLFRKWNDSFWAKDMIISSKQFTESLHISRSTYSKVIKQLDEWGYIHYNLSIGRQVGGKVIMLSIAAIKQILTGHRSDDNLCHPSIDRSSFLSFPFFEEEDNLSENDPQSPQNNQQTNTEFEENIEDEPDDKKNTTCLSNQHPLSANHAPPACETRSHNKINYKQENNINLTEREIMFSYSTGKTKINPDQSPSPSKKIKFVFSLSKAETHQNPDQTPRSSNRSPRKRTPAEPFANDFRPPSRQHTTKLFADLKFPENEATKFFNYYEKKGWTVGQGAPMTNLQAAVRSWMDRYREFSLKEGRPTHPSSSKEYYHVQNNNSKNYAQPL